MNNEVSELKEVSKSRAAAIEAIFAPMSEQLKTFEQARDDINAEYASLDADAYVSSDLQGKAKRLRLDVAKIRIAGEKAKTAEKKEIIIAGKAVDGVNNILKWGVSQIENDMKTIEKQNERVEKERTDALSMERTEMMLEFGNVDEAYELGLMPESVFKPLYESVKLAYENKIKEEKLAVKKLAAAEKKRKEEVAKLKKEAAEEKKKLAKVNARLKKQEDIAAANQAKTDAAAAEEKKKLDKAKADLAAAKAREEADLAKAKAKEQEDLAAAKAIKVSEANKGDIQRLTELADGFETFEVASQLSDPKLVKIGSNVEKLLKKIAKYVKENV